MGRGTWALALAVMVGCAHAPPPAPPPPKKLKLAVLPAESDAFPGAAKALTDSLAKVHLLGVDETEVSKVSLEVVQLSIECVEPTPSCYEAVGRSLSADKLLFAQIAPGPKRKQLKITITLFDVDGATPRNSAEKVFTSEKEAVASIADLVGEATR